MVKYFIIYEVPYVSRNVTKVVELRWGSTIDQ
jgi:hypothetical protein